MLNLGAAPPIVGSKHFGVNGALIEQPEQDARCQSLRVIGCCLLHDDMLAYKEAYADRGWHAMVCDGCRLPFADKSIDVVFSNAVIEHVPPEDQVRMAQEIMRVGRSWFVATPNYWYPIELHRKLPLFHYLPAKVQRRLDARLKSVHPGEVINLLSARDMLRLFPGSVITKVRVTFFPETVIAHHVASSQMAAVRTHVGGETSPGRASIAK